MKYLIALLAVAGMYVSARALQVHLMDPSAAPPCAVTEHWDCGTVNHSRFAVFPAKTDDEPPGRPHIPVATLGLIGYGLIALFALLGKLNITLELARIGFFCAAVLTYLEAFVIQMWCIYCVWSQGIIAAVLLTTVIAILMRRRKRAASMREVLREAID